MRTISLESIVKSVADLCLKANLDLRQDVQLMFKQAYRAETNQKAKKILSTIIENYRAAKREKLAICQDTGMACVFVELGQDVTVKGDLKKAIQKGVERGYRLGYFRPSIVQHPLVRGASRYVPAVIHIDIIKGNKLKLSVLPKGFGCENKTQLKMFQPTAPIEEIKKFIIDAVKAAGPDACPPYIVGVGIGGTADYALFLAKKALLRNIAKTGNRKAKVVGKLEQELVRRINRLNIGPMGLGGKNTVLGVAIETYPTHIAGLPVAVNISCHALRSAVAVL